MDNNERIVKGIWFPIEIWEAEDLDWNEKILLLEIDSFTSKGLDCYISNEYIAGLFKISERKAADMVSDLISKGYIIKTKFDGRRRFIESNIIAKLAGQSCKNKQGRVAKNDIADLQNLHTTYYKINNCSLNNQSNNKGGFQFFQSLLEIGVTPQTAKDWMAVRKEKRAANTETAFRRIQQEISKTGLTAEECIRMSAEHSWQGFKAEWVQKQTRAAPAQKVVSAYEHNRRLMEELMGAGFNETGGLIDEQ